MIKGYPMVASNNLESKALCQVKGNLPPIANSMASHEYCHRLLFLPTFDNAFALEVKGCTIYESIMTVNRIIYPNFQHTFYSLGLLYDDRKFITAINEVWSSIEKTICDRDPLPVCPHYHGKILDKLIQTQTTLTNQNRKTYANKL
ncbi:hypothetical protein Ahy_B08g089503 isoform G [Arachis hypogaea]|uniref:Uncharacterized protein n=1 Tax=Arachis hypogaea TaxID=3818 RepID=A0A444XY17_ARAHY|nr:hypothetical protein Ahy_B08g089503 isoform G [Arachis hypogaea]